MSAANSGGFKSTDASMPVPLFRIGGDLLVNRLGFGAMRLTGQPGNWGPYPDWEHGVRVLRDAVEMGVNFIDTADAYGPGDSEELIADALHPYAETIVIATKGGTVKTGPGAFHANGSPEYLRAACDASLRRLKRDCIDLYQLHRVDPSVPLAESVATLVELQKAGKIKYIGLSNITLTQLQDAEQVTRIASVQNRYNLLLRDDDPMIDYCLSREIAYLPWSPLGTSPFERYSPIASGTDGTLHAIASRHHARAGQVALAWLMYRSPNIVAIPGTTSLAHLKENVTASQVRLSAEDMEALNALFTKKP